MSSRDAGRMWRDAGRMWRDDGQVADVCVCGCLDQWRCAISDRRENIRVWSKNIENTAILHEWIIGSHSDSLFIGYCRISSSIIGVRIGRLLNSLFGTPEGNYSSSIIRVQKSHLLDGNFPNSDMEGIHFEPMFALEQFWRRFSSETIMSDIPTQQSFLLNINIFTPRLWELFLGGLKNLPTIDQCTAIGPGLRNFHIGLIFSDLARSEHDR